MVLASRALRLAISSPSVQAGATIRFEMAAQLIVLACSALAAAGVWYVGARFIGTLAALRGEDEAEWFRLALWLTPMLAWLLLVTNTHPPGRPR